LKEVLAMVEKALDFIKERLIYVLVLGVLLVGMGIGFNLGYDSAVRDVKKGALFSRLNLE
jgi:hypothetical protein